MSRCDRPCDRSPRLADHSHAHWRLLLAAVCICLGLAIDATFSPPAHAAVASCYGPGLYGNHMANGQTLTTSTVGVAHKTLPLGTQLFVRANHHTVRVSVTDRGPYVAGRSLDLTHATVRRLGVSDCYAWGHRSVTSWKARG